MQSDSVIWRDLTAWTAQRKPMCPLFSTAAWRSSSLTGGLALPPWVLAVPQGDGPLPRRNCAILALMGVHGLRVAEVAGLILDYVDLSENVVRVLGKGRKVRTVYLTDQTTQVLAD